MRPNYLIIPLITFTTATFGSWLTNQGMSWYQTINLPVWTPSGSVIGTVWTILFILAATSALIVWNQKLAHNRRLTIALAFVTNAVLNVSWSLIFFRLHLFREAILEAGVLGASILVLIVLVKPHSRVASLLLWPYFLWVSFATYLTYNVWQLNR